MKNLCVIFFIALFHKGFCQDNFLKIKVLKEDSTLNIIGTDSSYIYNVHIVSTFSNSISNISLVFMNKNSSGWVTILDSVYNCSNVLIENHENTPFIICKPNSNMFTLCLGRFYYSVRHKFTLSVNSSNGSLTKEFEF